MRCALHAFAYRLFRGVLFYAVFSPCTAFRVFGCILFHVLALMQR